MRSWVEQGGRPEGIHETITPKSFLQSTYGPDLHLGKDRLFDVISKYATAKGVSPNVAMGLYTFTRNRVRRRGDQLVAVLGFLDDVTTTVGTTDFFKSRGFNYINESSDVSEVFSQAVGNARYMTDLVGAGFFSQEDPRMRSMFKARIGNSDFFLSCKPGSGAGTFSLDIAIGIEKGGRKERELSELWRTGIDTETDKDGKERTVRIIRTGTGVKHDPVKTGKYSEFLRKYKTSPPRVLALLSLYLAYSLGANHIKALSTTGAMRLSSLKRAPNPYDYSKLFSEVGFEQEENPNWLSVPDLRKNFYNALETTAENQNGLRSHEAEALHEIMEAFQNLQDSNGTAFPIQMHHDESQVELERALATFGKIHGWKR